MPFRVLIIPDKFKGTLSAPQAASAIARGWKSAHPTHKLDLAPMSDGGDGFGSVLGTVLQATPRRIKTIDAAHRSLVSQWWWHAKSKTAIIDSAAIIGLAILPGGKFHPFQLDSRGLGQVLESVAAKGARRCLMGIGGSATNDGGFGMARILGWQFLARNGKPIVCWTDLVHLKSIHPPPTSLFKELFVAVDVGNTLLGMRGATRIFGPQKGLLPENFKLAEACLSQLSRTVKSQLGRSLAKIPGAGAAGGLGFGLMAFLNAKLKSGFELFANKAKLHQRLGAADLILTGEGALDDSSLMGKGVGEVARACRQLGKPCIALAGIANPTPSVLRAFTQIHTLAGIASLQNAQSAPAKHLQRLSRIIGLQVSSL